jgi:WhiB family redox-sensing transcriptional regulator
MVGTSQGGATSPQTRTTAPKGGCCGESLVGTTPPLTIADDHAGSARWQLRAACRGMDPNLFFPEKGAHRDMVAAVAVCQTCPVRTECLELALSLGGLDGHMPGVWGGLTARGRRLLRDAS